MPIIRFVMKLGMFCTHNRDINQSFHPSKILSVNAVTEPSKYNWHRHSSLDFDLGDGQTDRD
jgi:hypothetical protein